MRLKIFKSVQYKFLRFSHSPQFRENMSVYEMCKEH